MNLFDTLPDRRASGCIKWTRYAEDVLPMWVADMDFPVAQPIMDAIQARLSHPVLGYGVPQAGLKARIVDWLAEQYGWQVAPDAIIAMPGVVPGLQHCRRG